MSKRIDSYDVSPKMREVIDWRNARRKELREKYLRQILHPTKQKLVIDEAVERWAIMRIMHQYQIKLTGRSFIVGVGSLVAAYMSTALFVKSQREKQEHLIRTGQVSYADREFKFQ